MKRAKLADRVWKLARTTLRARDRMDNRLTAATIWGNRSDAERYEARLTILNRRVEAVSLIVRGLNLSAGIGVGPERFNAERFARSTDRMCRALG